VRAEPRAGDPPIRPAASCIAKALAGAVRLQAVRPFDESAYLGRVEGVNGLLDHEAFERLLSVAPEVKLVEHGGNGAYEERRVSGATALERTGEASVCIVGATRLLPEMAQLALDSTAALHSNVPVSGNLYSSPPGRGFPPHFDNKAALVLQLAGTKRWRFAARAAIRLPPRSSAALGLEPEEAEWREAMTVDLGPGDALYLPPGAWHGTRALERSLSITLSYQPLCGRHVLLTAIQAALEDVSPLAEPVPRGEQTEALESLLECARRRIASIRTGDLLAALRALRR